MISCRRIFQKQHLRSLRRLYPAYSSQAEPKISDVSTSFDRRLPDVSPKNPQKEPFVKNLLIGKFDYDMLAFPEAHNFERNKSFFQWLKPIEEYIKTVDATAIDKAQEIPPEVLNKLCDLGVFGSMIHEHYGGMNLLESEITKLIETLGLVPPLALYLIKMNKCVNLINKFGSEETKSELLPKIANGTLIPTTCITEEKTEEKKMIRMLALASQDDKFWMLSGKKIFVPYAHKANLFLIFCNCSHTNDPHTIDKNLSVLYTIAPKSMTCEHIETMGMRGLRHFNVNFLDSVIPTENMIGEIGQGHTMYVEYLSSSKHYSGAVAIGITKNFTNILTDHMIHSRHMEKLLHEHDSSKQVLGKLVHSLYAMESATYMTSALVDLYKDQDVAAEAALVESFCATECVKRILEGMYLVGTPAYLKKNSYELILRDAQALTMFEMSVIDSEILSVLLSLAHAGKTFREEIIKFRNPFKYPTFNIMDLFFDRRLHLKTGHHLHPSLLQNSELLEMALYKLKRSVNHILVKEGAHVANGHIDLRRLYEMMSLIYCLVSILSRSSRAYCDGLRNAEEELKVAHTFTYQTRMRVNTLYTEIVDGEWSNGDKCHKDVTKATLLMKGYFAEHPLFNNMG